MIIYHLTQRNLDNADRARAAMQAAADDLAQRGVPSAEPTFTAIEGPFRVRPARDGSLLGSGSALMCSVSAIPGGLDSLLSALPSLTAHAAYGGSFVAIASRAPIEMLRELFFSPTDRADLHPAWFRGRCECDACAMASDRL